MRQRGRVREGLPGKWEVSAGVPWRRYPYSLASFQPFTHLLKTSAYFVTLAGTWKTKQKKQQAESPGIFKEGRFLRCQGQRVETAEIQYYDVCEI